MVLLFLFILMDNKKEAAYEHVFRHIEADVFSLKCKSFTTDYEIATKNALKKIYGDNVEYLSCWFHFTQSVKRNASQIPGFFELVRKDATLLRLYYKFHCIPLLPADKIVEAFDVLKAEMLTNKNAAFQQFVLYYEGQWMEKVII